jgi:hypothetical protein
VRPGEQQLFPVFLALHCASLRRGRNAGGEEIAILIIILAAAIEPVQLHVSAPVISET